MSYVAEAISYAWQGGDYKKTAILAELEYSAMRLLGYNGPAVPDDKKTWKLQAMLK